MIEIKEFSKCYITKGNEAAVAVDRLSFEVEPGQVLGLVGRNGAGKTTTLRSITGIIPATSGELRVDGYRLSENPIEVKQRTAYVPDDPQLFEDLSVQQHLQFQASIYSIASPSKKISNLLEIFELAEKRHARADSLSRGMRQKLAICCAYLQRPSALLLDEPMTGLDPQAIRVLKDTVQQKAKEGVAVIISSHLLAMVENICSHVLVLDRGRCKFHGTIDEFHRKFVDDDRSDLPSLENAFFSALSGAETAIDSELDGQRLESQSDLISKTSEIGAR